MIARRFTSSTKPLDHIRGLRPMDPADEAFWRIRRERAKEREANQEEKADGRTD